MPDDPKKLSYAYFGSRTTLGIVLAVLLVVVGAVGVFVSGKPLVYAGLAALGVVCAVVCIVSLRLAKQGRARGVNPPK